MTTLFAFLHKFWLDLFWKITNENKNLIMDEDKRVATL